ncbi:DoxX family protein [Nitrincola nitratireducens]|uniref:DoxX n=1 Tax=Nitrincola nitratireducens TaxID=1229521 RepID=W9UZ70_9GAMM|nr:DoxX family protein [Nitrincola nitratireducens]EXJ12538.1 DoxX [Nitrincola nitratireducens]
MISTLISHSRNVMNCLRHLDGLAPLLMRLYLAPVMMQAGWMKLANFESTVNWFGNPDWGLGLPFPELMVILAGGAELIGGLLLIPGLAVRWFSVPLMVTMLVAALTVHWQNGWLAIADASSWLANDRVHASTEQLQRGREILRTHGNFSWLTQNGNFVILNNGVEFAATYFIMFLTLFYTGGGRYVSLDYWIKYHYYKEKSLHE